MTSADGPSPALRDVVVDDVGIAFAAQDDLAVDVGFDDQRIGSFWTRRDTEPAGGRRLWRWPAALGPHLDGQVRVSLTEHGKEVLLASVDSRLGSGSGRISIVDRQGNPLGLDKSNRLMRLFGDRSAGQVEPLLDSMTEMLAVLADAGVRPFIAYGTLLGAVREGALIGHDSDADLGYVSAHEHPADVIAESLRLQRRVVEQGYAVIRYSGLGFKVLVHESDGTTRGLDVFGGFMRAGKLYLMGEVGHDFEEQWLHPLATAMLQGRPFPVPARPERLLEAMYGSSWRVPDPAYRFQTPASTKRRLAGWFRGLHARRNTVWDPYYLSVPGSGGSPSSFVRWVHRREPDAALAVDVGCGRGADVAFLARRGTRTLGLDYSRRSFAQRARLVARAGTPASFEWMSLTELRSVMSTGVALAREPGPKIMLARHVADATNDYGRANLLRLARMSLGDGRLYLQVAGGPAGSRTPYGVRPLRVPELLEQIAGARGRVVSCEELADEESADPQEPSTSYRLVVQW